MSCSFKCHCGEDLVDDNSTNRGYCYDCDGDRNTCSCQQKAAPVVVAPPPPKEVTILDKLCRARRRILAAQVGIKAVTTGPWAADAIDDLQDALDILDAVIPKVRT